VSTEKQKLKGESLRTQETQIIQYVSLLRGIIPDNCWKYKGQEHSTPGFDRALLEKLLTDSSKGLFDAVIVTDASRWSRDNQRSEAGLNILCDNGIRFFVGVMEYDLHNPEHRFILGMSTSINQMQASKQSINSITNRIERAKRNINTAGRLPYGRTFDKKTEKWGIDIKKQNIIKQAAQRYLNGEGLPQIAHTLGLDPANLHRILTKHSGTTRSTNFKYKNINETISFNIPPLLDESTIEKIKERLYINKTYTRGNKKNQYLLTGFIFCSVCGLKLKAHTSESKKQYYLHSKYRKECKFGKFVPAAELENSILIQLVQTFGDPILIEKAIRKASPNMEKVKVLTKEKTDIVNELKKITSQKNNIIGKVADDLLSNEEIQGSMNKLREQEESFKQRLSVIESELSTTPDPEHIKRLSRWTGKVITDATKNNPRLIFKRSFEWKRLLIEKAFSGIDSAGRHLGIYMTLDNGKFMFEIKGMFESTINTLPLPDDAIMEIFKLDSEYQDVDKTLQEIRKSMVSNISSKHAVYAS
jgi:DNA invertase Pin-like site-specific DNA recombinase